ncbi:putative pyridoxal phosphate-dependent aminotransferase, enzyme apparently involved in regulation of cell wall biogenesis [Modestobacter italicus]|uniref:Pyridoxal phosphate-dependent aminotransferase, enzyme apparently involved in regulation of cell wall biogenesis n=1 Tax=Modestobacter italicus (strain DSM 44449 / CECT 9708 / BC 501) TaxID=2732864 RepID=I4EXK7_MODI5|nr:aminotransferase class I/II-fold pyridoxal phosphate-dependent enzyme [Modestobacter marinus]CCH88120.1 putative pyridoxal phosphate-dependent aminotransferase, enzyme apparently involved in regulation of cell wall biogenesis [Modestobacter marinus]
MTATLPGARTRILLSTPDVGDREEELVGQAVRSGWIAPLGPMVDAFEEQVADRCGRRHAVALSSGTAALHLALLQAGARPGTAVVVPTLTFAATANAAVYTGAEPVFVDCEQESGNLDPALLETALTTLRAEGVEVAAVVPVDLLGRCADHTRVAAVCERAGVPVVADAAESLGARHASRPAGSFGVTAALSFNGNKIMTTSGGGMLLTDDPAIATRARYLSTQARQPAVHYEHTEIGYNYRLSNVLAALGLAQLERLDGMIARRRALRAAYAQVVEGVPGVEVFQRRGDQDDNCWLTAVVVDPGTAGWTAEDLRAALDAADIESRPLWKPMHDQPVFAGRRSFLNGAADRLFATGLTLPSGSALTPDQVGVVMTALTDFLDRHR